MEIKLYAKDLSMVIRDIKNHNMYTKHPHIFGTLADAVSNPNYNFTFEPIMSNAEGGYYPSEITMTLLNATAKGPRELKYYITISDHRFMLLILFCDSFTKVFAYNKTMGSASFVNSKTLQNYVEELALDVATPSILSYIDVVKHVGNKCTVNDISNKLVGWRPPCRNDLSIKSPDILVENFEDWANGIMNNSLKSMGDDSAFESNPRPPRGSVTPGINSDWQNPIFQRNDNQMPYNVRSSWNVRNDVELTDNIDLLTLVRDYDLHEIRNPISPREWVLTVGEEGCIEAGWLLDPDGSLVVIIPTILGGVKVKWCNDNQVIFRFDDRLKSLFNISDDSDPTVLMRIIFGGNLKGRIDNRLVGVIGSSHWDTL